MQLHNLLTNQPKKKKKANAIDGAGLVKSTSMRETANNSAPVTKMTKKMKSANLGGGENLLKEIQAMII